MSEVVVGASQIAAILGIDRFTTAEQLYRRMRGEEPWEPENDDMARGKHLEPGLCSWWLQLARGSRRENDLRMNHGVDGVMHGDQLRVLHPTMRWARATPDMIAFGNLPGADSPQLLAVDVKCPRSDGKKVGEEWVRVWSEKDQVAPAGYLAQSIWQQGVLRAAGVPVEAGELAAGPVWGNLIRVAVPFDAEFFALMLERASVFRECVMSGAPLPSEFQPQGEAA